MTDDIFNLTKDKTHKQSGIKYQILVGNTCVKTFLTLLLPFEKKKDSAVFIQSKTSFLDALASPESTQVRQ